jgi:hypothetical protein
MLDVEVLETATSSATWSSGAVTDKKQGQNPSLYKIGIPPAPVSVDGTEARVGPVSLSVEEYQQYMEAFKLACRECAARINIIRMGSQAQMPSNLADQLGAVKETH